MFRPQPISSTDARKHFTRLINKVSFSSKSFVIKTYRQPIVRIVNENYIRALEEVIGKKTVNQVMQIAGNDRLFEADKIEQIKKVFQRRLSGSPRQAPKPQPPVQRKPRVAATHASPKPNPQPQRKPRPPQPQRPMPQPPVQKRRDVAAGPRPATPKPKPHPQRSKPNPQASSVKSPASKSRRVLLLQNGKNYQ